MKWFKMHSGLLYDATIQQLEPEMFRTWVNCLCMANEHKRRGELPERAQVAWSLRIPEGEAEERCVALVHEGLLEVDDARTFRIHNWDRWQGTPDERSTERVKRHRARMKARKGGEIRCPGARAMPYDDFLNSVYWQMRRGTALEAAGHRCSVCNAEGGERGPLDVHHRTYERLGHELDSDLIVLCRDCHKLFHGNGKLAAPPL